MKLKSPHNEEDYKSLRNGLIIVILPVIGYALNYAYELGYTSYFHLPHEFIRLSLESAFYATIALTGGLLFFLSIINVLIALLNPLLTIDRAIRAKIVGPVASLIIWLLFATIFGFKTWLPFLWIPPLLLVSEFLPVLTSRKNKTFREKVETSNAINDQVVGLDTLLIYNIGPKNFILVLLIGFLLVAAYSVGTKDAQKEEYFLVYSDIPTQVILRIYGDNFITAEESTTKGFLKPVFQIRKTGSDKDKWQILKSGPYKVE